MGTQKILFTADVWLHSDYKTGEAIGCDIFSVSGYKLPVDLITEINRPDGFDWLVNADVPMETVLQVQAVAECDTYDDGKYWWDITCTGWVEDIGQHIAPIQAVPVPQVTVCSLPF